MQFQLSCKIIKNLEGLGLWMGIGVRVRGVNSVTDRASAGGECVILFGNPPVQKKWKNHLVIRKN